MLYHIKLYRRFKSYKEFVKHHLYLRMDNTLLSPEPIYVLQIELAFKLYGVGVYVHFILTLIFLWNKLISV